MNDELVKFVSDPRYGDLTPEQRLDGYMKLEPRFGELRDDAERSKFVTMMEGQYRPQLPAAVPGSEKLGPLSGPAGSQGAPMREVMTPGKVADVTLGAIGGGVMHTVEGAGGVMRAAGMEETGKAVSDFGKKYGAPPKWLQDVAQSPDRLYDPAFVTNLAFEGLGSSLSFFLPGAAAGRAAATVAKLPIGVWRNAAAWAAGTSTAAVMESAVDAGSAYNEAIDKGVKPEVAANIFTETMKREVPTTLVTNALGEFSPRLGKKVWQKALQVGWDALMEGGEEVAQGVAQRSAENAVLGTQKPLLEGAADEFVGGALGGALMSGGRAAADALAGKPQPQPGTALQPRPTPAGEQTIDVDAIEAPAAQLGPGKTPGKPGPGRPPKALLEKPAIAAEPVGGRQPDADPFAPQHVDVDGQKMVLVRNQDGTYRGYNVSEGQALVPVQRKRGQENTAETEGPIPQGGEPQRQVEGREQKLLPGEVQKPEPRVFRSSEGLYFEEQPDGSYRGVQKPAPGKPPAGYLEEGPKFHMGPKTERGNRNKAGEQGPFEMPGTTTQVEEPATQVEKAEPAEEPVSFDTKKSTPVEKPAEKTETADDPWESFADDLSQAGVSIPHMVNSFQKNFGLDLEKEVREGRFGTNSISVDDLKDLAVRYPQKGAKPAPRKRKKAEPEIPLEDLLAASLRAKGIEVPAEPTADAREEEATPALPESAEPRTRPEPPVAIPARSPQPSATNIAGTRNNTSEPTDSIPRTEDSETAPQLQATAEEPKREYSSTQVAIPGIVGRRMKEASARIPDADLAKDGREDDPHVTVKYWLHGDDAEEVRKLLAGEGPIRVKLGKSSLFENDDADVLKVDVESEDLRRLNAKIAALPNSEKHPDYKPHATIAYLKPGSGKKYAGKPVPGVSGAEITIDTLTFSGKNGEKVEIPLSGESKAADAQPAPRPSLRSSDTAPASTSETSTPSRSGIETDKASAQPESTPQSKIIDSVQAALDKDGDAIPLEKIAEGVYGAKRTSGAFSKRQAYEAQEAGMNAWQRDNSERIMKMEPKQAIGYLRAKTRQLATQTVRDDEQVRKQQFSTPPHLAYLAQKVAAVTADDSVLEPSGGTGGLVSLVQPIAKSVHLNEIDPERAALARQIGFENQSAHDGEVINALLDENVKPSVVIMNPPFSAGALKNEGQGANKNRSLFGYNHVESALQRLAPGGRLVAILSGGMTGRGEGARMTAPAAAKFWERMAKKYNIRANVGIPGKEYSKYGTSFPTQLVVIDKNGPTPGKHYASQVAQAVTGDFESIEAAWDALASIAADRKAISENKLPAGEDKPATRVEPDRSGVLSPDDERSGGARKTDRGKGNRQRNPNPRPDAEVQARGNSQRDSGGEPRPEPAQTDASRSDRDRESAPQQPEELTGDMAVKRRQKASAKEDAGAFVIYEPTLEGNPHPGDIVETKSMATVNLPPLTYEPKLPAGVKISNVQLESVVLAGQQNERRNGDGSRGAALIGDGTGVGKGRTVAAMLLDNWNHGRKRLMWISEKWDLIEDAKRDLAGIGAKDLADKVVGLNKLDNKGTIELPEGVIFTTYDLIRSKDKKGNTTLATIEQWLKGKDEAEGAFIAFDEAHEMKNTVPAGRAKASQMGEAAKKLRDALPNVRSVFMSATSATEVENMGYLERLGLWGPKTPFPNGFAQFVNEVGSGGIATMELIARELKATGKYIARTLSYKGVKYDEVTAELNDDQREIYRNAASSWRMVTKLMDAAIETVNGGRDARAQFMSQYWSANQRFFNLLLTALKTPAAIELAERGLSEGKAIVITLQNTNEAAQNRQEAKSREDDEEADDLDFGPKDILLNLIREHYPVQQWVDEVWVDGEGKEHVRKVPLTKKDPETDKDIPVLNPEAMRERDALIAKLDKELHMPENPLDILINHFGRDKVAELTGRSKYYDPGTGRFEKRGGDLPRKKVNIAESAAFQDGSKLVAILSQAAGTGISLHASNDAKNQRQRWHVTLQAGWSADKAMQMLGRTHRTNQKHAPNYFTLVSDMSGEKRFLATIAKRMASLGALTRGSAEGAGGADMSNVNFESVQGEQAARTFVQRLEAGQEVPGVKMSGFGILQEMGLTKKIVQNGIEKEVVPENAADVRRILNRTLALDPDIQSKVFEYFNSIFEAATQKAIEEGTLDTGVKELQGDSIAIDEQRVLSADLETGAETHYYRVNVNSKLPVASVAELDRQMKKYPDGTFYVNSGTMEVVFAREAEPIVSPNGSVRDAIRIISPKHSNWQKKDKPVVNEHSRVVDLDTLIEREKTKAESEKKRIDANRDWAARNYGADSTYTKHYKDEAEAADKTLAEWKQREQDRIAWARELWEKQYEETPKTETEEHHMIGGAVLRWWNTIKQNQGIRLARDSKTGERVVGAVISPQQIQDVLAKIAGGRVQVSGNQVAVDVLKNGTEYQLERGVRIRRGSVSRNPVVQIMVPDATTGRLLQDLGVVYERGMVPVYYVPTTNQSSILDRILAQYPVENGEGFAKRLWNDQSGSLDLTALRQAGTKAARMVKDAYDVALKPMGTRIKDESPRLAFMLQHARDVGDVMAGGFLNRLIDANLDKLTKVEQGMLVAVLEGKMKRAPQKVVDAYRVIRNLEMDVAAIAQSLDVDPAKVLSRKYDQDAARSIPHQFAAAGEKLAQLAEFGKDNAELNQILKALGEVEGNPKQVKEWVERIFKGIDEGKTQEEKVTRFIRALQTAKLGLAFVPNASQAILNVTPASDFRALWAGYKALMSAEGRRFAVESGAAIDPVLAEAHQELGLSWLTQKFMMPFRLVEQHNRIVAASAGADFAARLWKLAQADTKKGKWAARRLADLGIDASTPLTRADILMAAKKFTDQTQFRSRPENLPAWTTSPWGRVFFQFKAFSYQQARFTLDQTIGELRRGEPLRAGRNLAMFALLGGGLGELIRLLRNLLTGKDDDPEGMERVAKAMASAGALGVMLDATQAMERGKELEWLAGPGADMGINAARLGWTWINPDKDLDDKVEATKKFAYRHMPLGSVAKGVEERLQ